MLFWKFRATPIVNVTAIANVHDITETHNLLREDDELVYGDSGYIGIEKRDLFSDSNDLLFLVELLQLFLHLLLYYFSLKKCEWCLLPNCHLT